MQNNKPILSSYKEILLSIQSNLKENVILTDTGSAKKEINKIIKNLNLRDVSWIGSHPISGTEDSGPKAGFKEIFQILGIEKIINCKLFKNSGFVLSV